MPRSTLVGMPAAVTSPSMAGIQPGTDIRKSQLPSPLARWKLRTPSPNAVGEPGSGAAASSSACAKSHPARPNQHNAHRAHTAASDTGPGIFSLDRLELMGHNISN